MPRASRAEPRRRKANSEALGEYRRKRDFSRTGEPKGGTSARPPRRAYVIQKHDASHLHYDLRLEIDGVMKSWAVPKGPSLDPRVKRLAVEVEDHPIEYNRFEGIIPEGEYGGGTVMLWDRGWYRFAGAGRGDGALREAYEKGELTVRLSGRRLKGEWTLVRLKRAQRGKPQWLLIKRTDQFARRSGDVTAQHQTSVASGRTLLEIREFALRSQ